MCFPFIWPKPLFVWGLFDSYRDISSNPTCVFFLYVYVYKLNVHFNKMGVQNMNKICLQCIKHAFKFVKRAREKKTQVCLKKVNTSLSNSHALQILFIYSFFLYVAFWLVLW